MDAFAGEGTLEVNRYGSLAVEVESVARAIRMAHLTDGVPYEDMAILLTSPRSMLPPLERALDALEVPFSISAPDRPLAREPIVRSFTDLAIFAFAEQPDPEHMAQLLRSPLIDLDDAAVRELERVARVSGRSLPEVVDAGPHEDWDDQMRSEDRAAHRTARSPPREEGLARGRSLLGRLGPVPVVRRSSGAALAPAWTIPRTAIWTLWSPSVAHLVVSSSGAGAAVRSMTTWRRSGGPTSDPIRGCLRSVRAAASTS